MKFLGNRRRETTETAPPNGQDMPPDSEDTSTNAGIEGRADAIHSSEYAAKCRRIMKLYQELRDLGVHVSFDLPRVVVIGDQSSGKSSLVEAVTGINVPRDSGTCTRCPMECTMSSGDESWSCKIDIRHEFDSAYSPLPRVETRPFTVIYEKSEMELAIRRAQAAVLSPHKESTYFLEMTATQLKQFLDNDPRCLKFSKNVVQIMVKDPEATDLSFVDLPGLIHNAESQLITAVRQLVEHYIEGKKNTLIVIAMPMTDDYEKMEAVRLAKERDPTGRRTIGVLTKPDLLVPGLTNALRAWKDVLEGKSHQTRHGYFCVRLPDDEQRTSGLTMAQLHELADQFFDQTPPWNEILDRSRFGIPSLVKYTSELLIKLILVYLPELERKVNAELRRCRLELDMLPHRPTDAPRTIIMLSITAFSQDISDMVFGNKIKHFVQSNRALYSIFKQDIIATTPDFRPFESTSETNSLVASSKTEPRSLQDVRQVIKRSITWELPKHIPFEVTKTLIRQYTDLWSKPALSCFDGVAHNLTDKLNDLLEQHFGQFFKLKDYIMKSSFADRDRCCAEAAVVLRKLLDFETDPCFTHNFEFFNEQERQWYSSYINSNRNRHPVQPMRSGWHLDEFAIDESEPAQPKPPAKYTFPKHPHDPAIDESEVTWAVDDEIKVMANVQAYFQVAHKASTPLPRFMDYVPLAIEHELNQIFAKRIQNTLIDSIFKDEQDERIDMEAFLDEAPAIATKRADLEWKIAGLERIKEKLDEFRSTDSDALSRLSSDEESVQELMEEIPAPQRGKRKKKNKVALARPSPVDFGSLDNNM